MTKELKIDRLTFSSYRFDDNYADDKLFVEWGEDIQSLKRDEALALYSFLAEHFDFEGGR